MKTQSLLKTGLLCGALGLAQFGGLPWSVQAQAPGAVAPSDRPGVQKTFSFEMRDQPWDKVLEWLGNNTGVPVVSPYKPQNTLNFFGTVKKSQYTIPEVIDLLNDALLAQATQKLLIVRRPTSILVVLADDPQAIDASLLPQLTVEDLDVDKPVIEQRYGRTEMARVLFSLKTLSPAEAQVDLKNITSPFGKVTPVARGNRILVQDMVGSLRRVKKFLDEVDGDGGAGEFEVVSLGALDGATVLKLLQAQYGITPQNPRPAGAPLFELDTVQNRLIIRGDPNQIQDVRQTLRKLGGGAGLGGEVGGINTATLRTINLEGSQTNASAVIENLNYLWPDLRANPVIPLTQSQLLQQLDRLRSAPPVAPPFVKPSDQLRPVPTQPATPPGDQGRRMEDPRVRQAMAQEPGGAGPLLDDPQAPQPRTPGLPGRADQPVFIAPLSRGNGIMIASEDAEALALIEEIVRYLTQPGEGDYEVIPIRHANSADVARVLDELYNGRRQSGPQLPFPMQMMMGGGGGRGRDGGGEAPTTGPGIRVVADPRTNSILVRATKMQMATIRRLLATDLDVPRVDSSALNKRYIIGPLNNADATEMVAIIKEIFKNFMAQSAQPQGPQMGFPFGRMPNQPQQNENQESIVITVAADSRTNSIILNAPESIYQQVLAMVEELDKSSADTTRTVRVFRTSVDPALVQRAYDAINGQPQRPGGQQPTTEADRAQQFRQQMMQRFMGAPQGGQRGGGAGQRGGGGGGGGGRPRGGGGRQASLEPGGPDFFVDRVTDDPRTSRQLFDPQVEQAVAVVAADEPSAPVGGTHFATGGEIVAVVAQPGAQQPGGAGPQRPGMGQPPGLPPGLPPGMGQPPEGARAPRGQVTIQAIPELGIVIAVGPPEDLEEFEKVLEELSKLGTTSETELRLIPMKHADAVAAAAMLNQIFARVNVGAASLNLQAAPPGQQQFGAQAGQQPIASIAIFPLPRFNALLVGAPRNRFADVEAMLEKIDRPVAEQVKFKTYALKKANATRAAAIITQFFNQRFPGETLTQNALRVQAEPSTNTLIVQASPADFEELDRLIEFLENNVSNSVNEVRIVPVENAMAQDVVLILSQAISESISNVAPTGAAPGAAGQPGGLVGTLVGQQPQQQQQQQQRPGQQGIGLGQTGFAPGTAGAGGVTGGTSIGNKSYTLRFVSQTFGGRVFETGLLEDVSVLADGRTNNVILFAPPAAMDLMLALIRELDQPSSLGAEIKVFPLKRADATATANTLTQLFMSQLAGGMGGQLGGAFGQQFGQQAFGQLAAQARNLAFTGSIVPLRVAVDQRTNSLIVAGSRTDLIFAEAILTRVDAAEVRERRTEVYTLRNSNATDIANSVQQYLNSEVQVLSIGELTPFGQIEKQVVVVPEVVSNKIILSGTPTSVAEVMRLIDQLDSEQPQVVIQVLIAQVQLDSNEEFGVEWGVQTPLLFDRGIFPGTGGNPGFNFNTTAPLGNNTSVSPSAIGTQGLANLGVGRFSPSSNVGGFVFSAGSDAVNVLIRALKTQGKIDVLSRPQITALANQSAQIQSGQDVPYVTGFLVNNITGQPQPIVNYRQLGIILTVQPRISPDGYVVMRVDPQISRLSDSSIEISPGVASPVFDITAASTTVHAMDGQTVVIGGLIVRADNRNENKIPWLGDLPYVGAAFRYRTQTKQRRELLILLTPRIVRTRAEAERIKDEEARKMNWALQEVYNIHGDPFTPPADCWTPPSQFEERLPLPTPTSPGAAPTADPAGTAPAAPPTPAPSAPVPPGPAPTVPPSGGFMQPPNVRPATPPPGTPPSFSSAPVSRPDVPALPPGPYPQRY